MGDEIYENKVRPIVEEGNRGKIVAIDIETADYEMSKDRDVVECTSRPFARNPDAQIWMVRIGYDAVYRLP